MARKGSPKSFISAVAEWSAQQEELSTDVARVAVKEFVSEYKAAAPNVTGNLANSITVASSPEQLVQGAPDQVFADNTAANNAVIDNMKLGDRVYVAALAAYNAKEEFGHTTLHGNTPGKLFGTRTAAGWRGFVKRSAQVRGMKAR